MSNTDYDEQLLIELRKEIIHLDVKLMGARMAYRDLAVKVGYEMLAKTLGVNRVYKGLRFAVDWRDGRKEYEFVEIKILSYLDDFTPAILAYPINKKGRALKNSEALSTTDGVLKCYNPIIKIN